MRRRRRVRGHDRPPRPTPERPAGARRSGRASSSRSASMANSLPAPSAARSSSRPRPTARPWATTRSYPSSWLSTTQTIAAAAPRHSSSQVDVPEALTTRSAAAISAGRSSVGSITAMDCPGPAVTAASSAAVPAGRRPRSRRTAARSRPAAGPASARRRTRPCRRRSRAPAAGHAAGGPCAARPGARARTESRSRAYGSPASRRAPARQRHGHQLGVEVLVDVQVGDLSAGVTVDDGHRRHAGLAQRGAAGRIQRVRVDDDQVEVVLPDRRQHRRRASSGRAASGNPRTVSCRRAHGTSPMLLRNVTRAPRAANSSASAMLRIRWPTPVAGPASHRIRHMPADRSRLIERLLLHLGVSGADLRVGVEPVDQLGERDRRIAEVVDHRLDQLPVLGGVQGQAQVRRGSAAASARSPGSARGWCRRTRSRACGGSRWRARPAPGAWSPG